MTTKLSVGLSVDIQRTNGRIHSAVVSSIDWATRSVTVEWSESEEIKGKEIDFEAIFNLNPNLEGSMPTGHLPPASTNQPLSVPQPKKSNVRQTNVPATGMKAAGVGGSLRGKAAVNNRATIAPNNGFNGHLSNSINESNIPTHPSGASSTNGHTLTSSGSVTAAAGLYSGTGDRVGGSSSNGFGIPTGKGSNLNVNNNVSSTNIRESISTAANRRRSNVVKEVDKIKKQRDERREQQERMRKEKNDLMATVDPTNPNWPVAGMIHEYRSNLDFRPLTMNDNVENHQICVAVRKRPMNRKELGKKDIDVITVPNKNLMVIHEPKLKVDLTRYLDHHMFRFDYAFDENADNETVYKYTAKPLVQSIFNGGMATCFAYGQTGSGKTHTMGGDFSSKGGQESSKGIYGLVAKDTFKLIKSAKYKQENLTLVAAYFEIYSGKVFDLLNNKMKLRVLEDAKSIVQVVGLKENTVENVDDVLKLITAGNNIRTSGQTSANNHSSRSHAIFQLILRDRHRMRGKISLVDLAGNERGADTSSASRTTRMEGAEINKSLLALKECIRALGRRGAHLPFRASKLTQVLRDSFLGENSRTCMIAMISPGMLSCEHSLNTLRYADRVKELGTEGPDMRTDDGPHHHDDDEQMQCEDDLALIHNTNQKELPDDMYTFHEAISHLQEMEEEIVDNHKNLAEQLIPQWANQFANLLKMTSQVDYDVDSYAHQLKELVSDQVDLMSKFHAQIDNFRTQLTEEEVMSRRIHN